MNNESDNFKLNKVGPDWNNEVSRRLFLKRTGGASAAALVFHSILNRVGATDELPPIVNTDGTSAGYEWKIKTIQWSWTESYEGNPPVDGSTSSATYFDPPLAPPLNGGTLNVEPAPADVNHLGHPITTKTFKIQVKIGSQVTGVRYFLNKQFKARTGLWYCTLDKYFDYGPAGPNNTHPDELEPRTAND